LTDELLAEFEAHIESWALIPSSGGVFEIVADEDLVFSKRQTGRHPTVEEVRAALRERLGS
jgi:selenoprotein W-related protein